MKWKIRPLRYNLLDEMETHKSALKYEIMMKHRSVYFDPFYVISDV